MHKGKWYAVYMGARGKQNHPVIGVYAKWYGREGAQQAAMNPHANKQAFNSREQAIAFLQEKHRHWVPWIDTNAPFDAPILAQEHSGLSGVRSQLFGSAPWQGHGYAGTPTFAAAAATTNTRAHPSPARPCGRALRA